MGEHCYLLLKEGVIQLFYGGRLCRLLVSGFVFYKTFRFFFKLYIILCIIILCCIGFKNNLLVGCKVSDLTLLKTSIA